MLRPCFDQPVASIFEDCGLRIECEILEVFAPLRTEWIAFRKAEPFGVAVQLHLVPCLKDRVHDRVDGFLPPHQCGHRIDEEHALDAVAAHHLHLVMNADLALRTATGNRPIEIERTITPRPFPVKAGGIFGVDRDQYRQHVAWRHSGQSDKTGLIERFVGQARPQFIDPYVCDRIARRAPVAAWG